MQIEYKNIKQLKEYEKNPRNNEEAVKYVANSIKEFGFKVPIIVDKNNVIVAGHTRYKASKLLKLETVPVIVADDLTDEQIKAFRLADNKVSEVSEWNFDLLSGELEGLSDFFDMTDFGFELNLETDDKPIQEDDFCLDDAIPDEPKSKYGDIYQLGNHRLMCGDSTKPEDVDKLMNGAKADLLITDPPYNVDYNGNTEDKLKIKNDNLKANEFYNLLFNAFTNANRVLKEGASFYVWYASREVVNFHTTIENSGFSVREELIWKKNALVLGRSDYQWIHEPCMYGWKDGAGHQWFNDRKQTTVIEWDRPLHNDIHPTMKPIGLFDYEICNSSKKGDCILDLFGGSGTTIMACEQNGRVAYTMELDPKYVDAILTRWETYTGEKAIKL